MSRRSDSSPEVRLTVNGATFLLSTIVPFGAWGKLRHTTRLNGSWAASWSIPNTTTWRHPALVYGARVEIVLGPIVIWSGLLEEPDWDSGQFVAIGACREAETTFGLDSLGNASTKPNEVIDAAIAAGDLTWIRVGDFGTTAVGDPSPTAGLVTLTSILDTWAKKNGSRWYVNELRQLVIAPLDENTPKWLIVPGSGVLGSASEQRVDRIYARYIDSATGRRTTIVYPSTGPARVKKPADFTKDGAMTAAAAQTMAQSLWNENNAGRSGFTNGWTLTRGQITTIGGAVADGALVKAGDPAAGLGLADTRGLAQNTLVVLGDTEYDWEDDELQANPNGLVDRDTDSVLEQVGNLAVAALTAATANQSGDTGWIDVVFQNGWVNFDTRTVQYRRRDGEVWLRGIAKNGTIGAAVFTLPPGFRPPARVTRDLYFAVPSVSAFASATVNGDGQVLFENGSNTWITFDGIRFLVD